MKQEHRQPTASTIVKESSQGDYNIPEFQRNFVWKAKNILDLADSLTRKYPVGSMLTWKADKITAKDSDETKDPDDTYNRTSWIIDGQQRITALCTIFGVKPCWWSDQDWKKHLIRCQVRLDLGKEELTYTQRRTDSSRYVPLEEIIQSEEHHAMAKRLISEGQTFTDNVDTVIKRLNEVGKIKESVIPIVQMSEELRLTEVAEIFNRLNSKGTRVSPADISLAYIATRHPGWVNREFNKFLKDMEQQNFKLEPRFLLRTMTGTGTGYCEFRKVPDSFWNEIPSSQAWKNTMTAMQTTLQTLIKNGIVNQRILSTHNAITAMAIYMARFPESPTGPVLEWILQSIRAGLFNMVSNTQMDKIAATVKNAGNAQEALKTLNNNSQNHSPFNESDFLESRNPTGEMMLYLLAYRNNAQDWDDKANPIQANAPQNYKPEYHHIFPRKWLQEKLPGTRRKDVDAIANLAVISAQANRKIAARPPRQYVPDMNLASRNLLIQQHIPDPTFVEPEQYPDWLKRRALELAKASNQYLKELRQESTADRLLMADHHEKRDTIPERNQTGTANQLHPETLI